MTQSPPQQTERKFFAVDFRGIQPASRARTALAIFGPIGLEVIAALPAPPPAPAELEDDEAPRPALAAAGDVSFTLGGEAARAAFAYATLGGLARLCGTVGNDAAGDLVERWLAAAGVGLDGLRRAKRTPVAVLVAAAGYQTVAIVPAAEAAAGAGPFGDQVRTLLLAGYAYSAEWRGEGAARLLREARARGLRTVVSLAPVALGGAGAPLTPADLEPVLPHVDLICGGSPELRRATHRRDPQEAARALLGAGARAVLAKRGPEGAAVFRPGPAALEREDTATPAAAGRLPASPALHPLRRAAAFGAVYDAAYLLGEALNDAAPVRFAAAAAVRAALAPQGVLGM